MDFAEIQTAAIDWVTRFRSSIWIVVGFVVAYFVVSRAFGALATHGHLPGRLVGTLRRVAAWVLMVACIGFLLQSLGVLESVFTAVSGFLALIAIGFVAVWSVLSNTLCSLMLLIVRPFRVGDALRFPPDDMGGRVVNFNMLYTTLETEDGAHLHIPNNMFFQRPVLRRGGRQRLELDEQLYRTEDARLDGKNREPSRDKHHAA
jgi:small-conductance mechanosensitive channel